MVGSLMGFIELGGIVLAWMIWWNFLIKAYCANHSNNVAAQGMAAVLHA